MGTGCLFQFTYCEFAKYDLPPDDPGYFSKKHEIFVGHLKQEQRI